MTLTGVSVSQTYAANAVEVDRKDCKITVSVDIVVAEEAQAGQNQKYVEDFKKMSIPVDLYRVAEVDVTGQKYTNLEPFGSVNFSDINSDTTAKEWKTKAEDAVKDLEKATPVAQQNTVDGVAEFNNLATGMYLVVPEETYNTDYTTKYTFTPYLTALPSSEYTLTGQGSDTWTYETTIGLKPEAEPQLGDLLITKTLQNYNATLGNVSFVFQVERFDEAGTPQPNDTEVYSITYLQNEVQSQEDLTKTIKIEGIPAGWKVRVTEIYDGPSYVSATPTVVERIIYSQEAIKNNLVVGDNGETAVTASAVFENRYDGKGNGGYGVMNQFTNGGQGDWDWEQITMPEVPASGN